MHDSFLMHLVTRNFVRNVEYSILPVMSELSTVRCNRSLGLWIAGTRASSVDGELPWRSSGRAAAVASTPGSRAQAAMALRAAAVASTPGSSETAVWRVSRYCFRFAS